MKQILNYVQNLINYFYINFVLFLGVVIVLTYNLMLFREKQKVDYAISKIAVKEKTYPIASKKSQEEFDAIIAAHGLAVNNKNVEYLPFEKQENIIITQYDLVMSGTYLQLLGYLNTLYDLNMIYKIDLLDLKSRLRGDIVIKMKLKSLYEIN